MQVAAVTSPRRFEGVAARLLPIAVILGASIAVRSDLAAAWPHVSTLLYVWAVADSTILPMLASAPQRRLPADRALAALSGAALTILVGGGAGVRGVLAAHPVLASPLLLVLLVHIGWGAIRAARQLRQRSSGDGTRWVDAAAEILPRPLVELAAAELRILRLALFSWREPPDVPEGTMGYFYHVHLAPMAAVLLSLQAIEIGVVHLLVALWSPKVATILLGLSLAGFLYLLGLIKSFRLRPVLLTPTGVRIRSGLLIDRTIPFDAIAGLEANPAGDVVRDPGTWNVALLAWPNLVLHLRAPIARRGLKPRSSFRAIAFRLDEPAAFVQRFSRSTVVSPASG